MEIIDDDKWNEMDGNTIADLHLALVDEVLFSMVEKKTANEIWDTLIKLYEAKSLHKKKILKKETIYFSNSEMNIDNWPYQHLQNFIFTTHNIGS